jgi:hypothetical protein
MSVDPGLGGGGFGGFGGGGFVSGGGGFVSGGGGSGYAVGGVVPSGPGYPVASDGSYAISPVPGSGSIPVNSVIGTAPAPAPTDSAVSSRIVLINPGDTGAPVGYRLGNANQVLQSGEQQDSTFAGRTVVVFDRGAGNGRASYSLSEGTYRWKVTSGGWDLFRVTFRISLDNSASGGDFRFQQNGADALVPAGQSQAIASAFPVVIAFDRGDGSAPTERSLQTGTYRVAVSADSGTVDLVPVSGASDAATNP